MNNSSETSKLHTLFKVNIALGVLVFIGAVYFMITEEYANLAMRQQTETLLNIVSVGGLIFGLSGVLNNQLPVYGKGLETAFLVLLDCGNWHESAFACSSQYTRSNCMTDFPADPLAVYCFKSPNTRFNIRQLLNSFI